MSEFRTCLEVRLLPESHGIEMWQLTAPLIYQSDVVKEANLPDFPDGIIEVETGFITNFVSFEALNWTAHRPSAVHDKLYSLADFDRELADKVLREALEVIGTPELLIDGIYLAVRTCGGAYKTK